MVYYFGYLFSTHASPYYYKVMKNFCQLILRLTVAIVDMNCILEYTSQQWIR